MEVDLPYRIDMVQSLSGHSDRAWHAAWNPTKPLLTTCSADKTVRMYSYTPARSFTHITTIPTGHTKTVRSIAWAPSGETLATASFDANIGIWEQEAAEEGGEKGEWECASLLEGHETECKSVAYSASGTLLASCSRDKTVWIWEGDRRSVHPDSDFECMGVLMEHTQDVKCVAWHPTEEILASASYDDTIKLYIDDPSDDWFCFSTLTGHTSTVWSLAWSPTNSYLASASDDKTVRIWRRVAEHKWECALVISGNQRTVFSVSWGVGKSSTPSLGWLAAVGGDGFIRIWEISHKENPETLEHRLIAEYPEAHGVHDVNAVSWCPRSDFEDMLATTGDDGEARVWRVQPVT
ncbi:putative cytosolic iron-sulfur protein assembly protein 1 [Mycena indigotica]|uniref:Probable cytosolic iron-sulfur protein assembly protein 1 n=1 Tax=Mycena indigotica TaxID=2126181 RepID=A0A8H6W3I8_9AGAR|nr:putative cytosolic iron-sulfur protein assembly protein 1 [Mycena indigotica]KAF7301621.1 putative cytosolic iron-sulfur protein assembly protein 1 [Mycena indigotica]